MATATLPNPGVLFHMTSEQFCALPPSETVRLELLDGEVIMAARPAPDHQHFLGELYVVLRNWVRSHRLGHVFLDTLMKVGGRWTPAPDLCFLETNHRKRVKRKRIEGPVDLAVEVTSPWDKKIDRVTKFKAYAQFGIPWYWIVDLRTRVLDEYELVGRAYANPVSAPFDQPFAPRLFPGLVIHLASLEWE